MSYENLPQTKHKKTMETTRPDIKLSTGKVIAHKRESNGYQLAFTKGYEDGENEMTHEEWQEYCEHIVSMSNDRKGIL